MLCHFSNHHDESNDDDDDNDHDVGHIYRLSEQRAIIAFVMINYVCGENLAFSYLANSGDNDANISQMSHNISDLTTKLCGYVDKVKVWGYPKLM